MTVKRTERGWIGHYILGDRCLFRRNTLIEKDDIKIVISTVGLSVDIHAKGYPNKITFQLVSPNAYFETKAFHAKANDLRYNDIDVERPIYFASPCYVQELNADDIANSRHEEVVFELIKKLEKGEKL